jgi:hypothetical protein
VIRPVIAAFVALAAVWATAALGLDSGLQSLGWIMALLYAGSVAFAFVRFRAGWRGILGVLASLLVVVGWWFTIPPSNSRNWQRDVDRTAWADLHGDFATIHNVRNFRYKTETDYAPRWETWEVQLSKIRGIDLFVTHWGSPWIAHGIVSFDLGDGRYLAASIEVRKEVGESYSALRGFFRQFELIYLAADERDVIQLRTTYRKDEEVRLYRTRTTPRDAQTLFVAYLGWMNAAHKSAEWYNAFTRNCTTLWTSALVERNIGGVSPWDWRIIANGRGDRMLFELGDLVDEGLGWEELQKRALINPAAKQAEGTADFSRRIRLDRPGF